jgi:hypothetical protein
MIRVSVEFDTFQEAQEFLAQHAQKPFEPARNPTATEVLARQQAYNATGPDGSVLLEPIVATIEKVLERGRPKKAPAPEPVKEYGIEDCRAALSALFDAKGRESAKAALAEFKVARVGELTSDQYRGFVGMCETLSEPE